MTKQEFKQVVTAITGAVNYDLAGTGCVLPLATALNILNTHCEELQASIESDDRRLVIRFSETKPE